MSDFAARLARARQTLAVGELDEAAGAFTLLLQECPSAGEARLGLSRALALAGHLRPALDLLSPFFSTPAAQATAPAAAWLEAALIHRLAGGLDAARRTLQAAPPTLHVHPAWRINLADVLLEQGHPASSRDLLAADPSALAADPHAASAWLRAQLYLEEVDAPALLAATARWAAWHGGSAPAPPLAARLGAAPRRLAFVSSRLCAHNSAQQLLSLLPPLRNLGFHLTLIATGPTRDAVSAQLRGLADAWLDIAATLPDAAARAAIRACQPDVAIELNEHSNNGRLALFSQRLAPVQLHWFGNAVTTGLRSLDARISDPITEPPASEADAFSAEPIIRLPGGYHAYTPPAEAAAPRDPPPDAPLTFGGIPHLAKCGPSVLAAWAALLRARPSARLLLARNSLGDAPTRSAFAARCAAAGLPLSQVELRGDDGRVRDLSIFNEIDLVLDTWPFAGDATSMDALWMGVPVLTLYGRRITSRRSAALLLPLGREDLVVHSPAAYVARALELTADVRALRATRSTLRTAVRAGPWCDAAQVARSLAETFQLLWLDRLK